MVYISGGKIVAGPPPPPLLQAWWSSLVAAVHRRPLAAAACAVLLLCLVTQLTAARDLAALQVPTLAHSRPPSALASDAAIARDAFFAHHYSRAKPTLLTTWRERLEALAMKGRGMEAALPQRAARLTGAAKEWAAFGEYLGDEWSTTRGGFTRCAQASYAVETYFCGSGAAIAMKTLVAPREGVAALEEAVQRASALKASLILEVTLTDAADEAFGHHFALRVAPGSGGVAKLYMSFISQYTLGAYLTRHPAPLSAAQWGATLQRLRTLEAASGAWGEQAEDAYEALFNVNLGVKGSATPKKQAGEILISHFPVCIVPPWNGTAADPWAAGHAESVQQLLPWALQRFSMYGAAAGADPWAEAEEVEGEEEEAEAEAYF
jgi:hypothetical protein